MEVLGKGKSRLTCFWLVRYFLLGGRVGAERGWMFEDVQGLEQTQENRLK